MSRDTGDTCGDKFGIFGTTTLPKLGTLGTPPLEGVSRVPGREMSLARYVTHDRWSTSTRGTGAKGRGDGPVNDRRYDSVEKLATQPMLHRVLSVMLTRAA
jgi:hypothetical protein